MLQKELPDQRNDDALIGKALRPVLWHGNAQAARIHLESLRSCEQAEPIEALEDAITCLDSRREWIGDYEQWRQQGFPVGSGIVLEMNVGAITSAMKMPHATA